MRVSWKTLALVVSSALLVLQTPVAQERGLQVAAKAAAGTEIQIGRQYAVLIGIDRYAEWPSLRNPVKDARAIREILARRYFIDEFIELYDDAATATGIRRLFDDLIRRIGPTDSVFVYYAGHGYTDKYNTGFWIPSDGSKDIMSQDRWIGNGQIRNFLGLIKARSLVLVSDSCFSGDLLNVQRGAAPTVDSEYWRSALRYTAKQVLTSGASESVPDESEFARQLKSLLEGNTEACLDPLAMYDRIRRGVTKTLPLLGTLPGHETGASFVLFLRKAEPPAPAKTDFILSVEVDKQATNVYINGELKGQAPLELSLEPGDFEIALSGPFVRPWSTKAVGKAGEGIRLSPRLPSLGAIVLDSATLPVGAQVMLDGAVVAFPSLTSGFPAEPGTRKLRLESPPYRAWEGSVNVKAEEFSIVRPELVFKTASLKVEGVPAGANCLVEGAGYSKGGSGEDAVLHRDLRVGEYTVTVSHPLWSADWSAKQGLSEEKEYGLVVPTGWIELPVPPEGARITLNGKPISTLKASGERLATPPLLGGTYRLSVTRSYMKPSESDIAVQAGKAVFAALRYEEFGLLNLTGIQGLEVVVLGEGLPFVPTKSGEGLEFALPGGKYLVKAKKSEDIDFPWSTAIEVKPQGKVELRIPAEAGKWSLAWRIRDEKGRLDSLRIDLEKTKARRRSRATLGGIGLVAGGVSGGAAGILYFLGSQAMAAYRSTNSTSDALAKRAEADLFNKLFMASASLSGAGLGIGGVILATAPNQASLKESVERSVERLRELEGEKSSQTREANKE